MISSSPSVSPKCFHQRPFKQDLTAHISCPVPLVNGKITLQTENWQGTKCWKLYQIVVILHHSLPVSGWEQTCYWAYTLKSFLAVLIFHISQQQMLWVSHPYPLAFTTWLHTSRSSNSLHLHFFPWEIFWPPPSSWKCTSSPQWVSNGSWHMDTPAPHPCVGWLWHVGSMLTPPEFSQRVKLHFRLMITVWQHTLCCLPSLPCLTSTSPTVLPRITSQGNYFHSNPRLRV